MTVVCSIVDKDLKGRGFSATIVDKDVKRSEFPTAIVDEDVKRHGFSAAIGDKVASSPHKAVNKRVSLLYDYC